MDEVALPVLEVELGDCKRIAELETDDEDDIDEDSVDNDELLDVEAEAATSCLAPHTFTLETAAPTDNFK
jgi:hypothetical protein